jgi:hypothetical protein
VTSRAREQLTNCPRDGLLQAGIAVEKQAGPGAGAALFAQANILTDIMNAAAEALPKNF